MSPDIIHATIHNFEREVVRSELPVLIDFWAPWCGPCRAIAPILDELAARYRGQVRIAKVNVDEEPALAGSFRIQGIPTLAAMRDGKVVDVMVGFRGRAPLEALVARLARPAKPAKDARP